jgi:hypothetical protein
MGDGGRWNVSALNDTHKFQSHTTHKEQIVTPIIASFTINLFFYNKL